MFSAPTFPHGHCVSGDSRNCGEEPDERITASKKPGPAWERDKKRILTTSGSGGNVDFTRAERGEQIL